METIVIIYGKTYNEEMDKIVDRRNTPKIWHFMEFRQTWVAYRKDENTIVVTQDDGRLDFTRVIIMTPEKFADYKIWRMS